MVRNMAIFLAFNAFSALAQFAVCVDSGIVSDDAIVDASGMAVSRLQESVVWVCNGHSDHGRIHALNSHGKAIAAFYLKRIMQRNWEDMASGPGPDPVKTYLYVGEIGDNDTQWAIKTVYRFAEPYAVWKGDSVVDTVKEIDKLEFVYPDTFRNAEAMMVDPLTKDYYIISKHSDHGRVYRARYPQPTASVDTLEYLDSLPYGMITAADISASGLEILIKNYFRIYYWKRAPGESVIQTVVKPSTQKVPYQREPVGEAMCWSGNADGYFTLSEERDSIHCRLYYYARLGVATTPCAPTIFNAPMPREYRLSITPFHYRREFETARWFDLSGKTMRPFTTSAAPLIHRITLK